MADTIDLIDSIWDELEASLEEELARDLNNLVKTIDVSDQELEWAETWKETKEEISDLSQKLIDLNVNNLSQAIDDFVSKEQSLSHIKNEQFQALLDKMELRKKEIQSIKEELRNIEKPSPEEFAKHLYDNHWAHYDAYIKSQRYKSVKRVDAYAERANEFYSWIPWIWKFFQWIYKMTK